MAEKLQLTLEPICLLNKFPIVKITTISNTEIIELKEVKIIDVFININQKTFSIEFLNKVPKDTKVINGTVVEDLAVIIKRIDYRGIDFLPYIDDLGHYYTNKGELITGTHGFMAFAGQFNFNISRPLFIISRDMAILNGQ